MAMTNNLRKMVDQPVWEWMRYSPFTSAATNTLYTAPAAFTGSRYSRYVYATAAQIMYQYDTYSDSWSTMASALPNNPASTVGGNFNVDDGHYGNFISALSGSTTASGAFINESAAVGFKIAVVGGSGIGQERTIVSASKPVDVEYLTPTATMTNTTTGLLSITDSTKKWVVNQWRGYQVRAYLGTSQQYFVRRVLYNNNDTLFFANAEWHVIDPHQAFNHVYDANVINVATTSRCVIQHSTIEVDSPWICDLDKSSRFVIKTGVIEHVQNISTNAFFLAYKYDPLYANWFPRHVIGGVLPNYLAGTTLLYEPIVGSLTPTLVTGTLTSGSLRRAVDSTQNWRYNQWRNYEFQNTTTGQKLMIFSNDQNTLYFSSDMDAANSGSHQYNITVDDGKGYIAGGNFASMGQYSTRNNSYYPAQRIDEGVANIAHVRYSSSMDFQVPISAITRTGNVATVTTITGHPFVTGDRVFVSGAVGADSVYYNGVAVVTSSYPLNTALAGATQPTAFTYGMSGTPAANAALNTHTTTVIYDASKNWVPNEFAGQVVQVFSSAPTAPTVNYSRITSNTSQSLTLATTMASVATLTGNTGVWGYNIMTNQSFGTSWGLDNGYLTGTSSYYLTGSTVSGQPFVYMSSSELTTLNAVPFGAPITGSGIAANSFYRSYETSSNGLFVTASLTANAASTQNNVIMAFELSSSRGFGSATSGIAGTLTDTTKNWPTNFWVGAQIRFLAGTGVGQEASITSNTATTVTFGTTNSANGVTATPDSTTVYNIIPLGRRNTTSTTTGAGGAGLVWVYGRESGSSYTNTQDLGKYIWSFEAGATMRFAKYNISTMQYEYPFIMPFGHLTNYNLTTGTMYAYDGKNRIYIQPNATAQFIYIDTDKDVSENAGTLPVGMGTAVASNKMVLKTSADGLDFLYLIRHSDTPFLRQMIFF